MYPEISDGIFELFAALVRSGFGWRLLLSRRYRAAARARWDASNMAAGAEIGAALVGLVASLAAAVWAARTLL